MKYLILFSISLVSQVYCDGEYWFDTKSRTYKIFKDGAPGVFDELTELFRRFNTGTYAFRAIPETSAHETPEIVITFEFIASSVMIEAITPDWMRSLIEIEIKEIKINPNFNFDKLFRQTKRMGKNMFLLFYKEFKRLRPPQQTLKLKTMLLSFVYKIMKKKELTIDQKIDLCYQFAEGLNGYEEGLDYMGLGPRDIKDTLPNSEEIREMRLAEKAEKEQKQALESTQKT